MRRQNPLERRSSSAGGLQLFRYLRVDDGFGRTRVEQGNVGEGWMWTRCGCALAPEGFCRPWQRRWGVSVEDVDTVILRDERGALLGKVRKMAVGVADERGKVWVGRGVDLINAVVKSGA